MFGIYFSILITLAYSTNVTIYNGKLTNNITPCPMNNGQKIGDNNVTIIVLLGAENYNIKNTKIIDYLISFTEYINKELSVIKYERYTLENFNRSLALNVTFLLNITYEHNLGCTVKNSNYSTRIITYNPLLCSMQAQTKRLIMNAYYLFNFQQMISRDEWFEYNDFNLIYKNSRNIFNLVDNVFSDMINHESLLLIESDYLATYWNPITVYKDGYLIINDKNRTYNEFDLGVISCVYLGG